MAKPFYSIALGPLSHPLLLSPIIFFFDIRLALLLELLVYIATASLSLYSLSLPLFASLMEPVKCNLYES